ncbi:cytochrome P450 [Atractiella rhizophila]|nr:cytochrome P450 [Atractiella rhizophila]
MSGEFNNHGAVGVFLDQAKKALQLSSIYLSTLCSSIVVYRLVWHPLRDVPGPLLGKLSQLWAFYSTYRGEHYKDVEALHRRYNSAFVRIGPNEVSVVHEDAVNDILSGSANLPKSRQFTGVRGGFQPALINIRDPAVHAERRKYWARGFTPQALKEYNVAMDKRVVELMIHLKAHAKRGPVDLNPWFKAFLVDVVGDVSGFNFQKMSDGSDSDGFWAALSRWVQLNASLRKVPAIFYLFNELFPTQILKMYGVMNKKLRERLKKRDESKDIFYYILGDVADRDPEEILPQYTREAILLVTASADTTHAAVLSLVYELLCSEFKYKELQGAIDSLYFDIGASGADPLPQSVLCSSGVLSAYINEILRIFPPGKSGQPREIPKGGRTICGKFFPEGTTISTPAYAMQRSPKFFSPGAHEFRPERWLHPEKEASTPLSSNVFFPFSYGPMNCIGKGVALDEMRTLISVFLRTFDFEVVKGGGFETFAETQKDWIVTVAGPLTVKLRERKV